MRVSAESIDQLRKQDTLIWLNEGGGADAASHDVLLLGKVLHSAHKPTGEGGGLMKQKATASAGVEMEIIHTCPAGMINCLGRRTNRTDYGKEVGE